MSSQNPSSVVSPSSSALAGLPLSLARNWLRTGLILCTAALSANIALAGASTRPITSQSPDAAHEAAVRRDCAAHGRAAAPLDPLVVSALSQVRQSQHGQPQPNPAQPEALACPSPDSDHPSSSRAIQRQKALSISSIPVSRTPFDDHWRRVRSAPPPEILSAQLAKAGVHRGMEKKEKLRRINSYVNQKVTYLPDENSSARRDRWAKASETIASRAGDCEDYAILKLHLLRAAGYPAEKIRFVLARDMAANRDHAFLVAFTPSGSMVLDNNVDRVYSVKEAVALRPIMSFSEDNRWVHGIREDA